MPGRTSTELFTVEKLHFPNILVNRELIHALYSKAVYTRLLLLFLKLWQNVGVKKVGPPAGISWDCKLHACHFS